MTDDKRRTKNVKRKNRKRSMATVAGAGLLFYLLLRAGGTRRGNRRPRTPAGCKLALRRSGLALDGIPTTIDDAVAACAASGGGAELLITGDARHGDFTALRDAMEAAGVKLAVARPVLRNAGLVYRPVGGGYGDPYPEWLRGLKGVSGVYVIRERERDGTPVVVYVGESHSDRLYDTLTRHFQDWRRYKGFWSGQYAEGHDPGLTYDRAQVEVAVKVTSPSQAIDEEARLIRRLKPRDNLIGQGEAEAVPF